MQTVSESEMYTHKSSDIVSEKITFETFYHACRGKTMSSTTYMLGAILISKPFPINLSSKTRFKTFTNYVIITQTYFQKF
jgi:hypothetical protein